MIKTMSHENRPVLLKELVIKDKLSNVGSDKNSLLENAILFESEKIKRIIEAAHSEINENWDLSLLDFLNRKILRIRIIKVGIPKKAKPS